jgi:16S rRNA (guanine966-N2)-methyltransferase
MRVVGGRLRGRSLVSPEHEGLRPTSDRVREAVFNILVHGLDCPLEGTKVLDLFAGTGALGIEALSRGAAFCLFIDDSAEARGLIRRNIEALGLTGITKVFRRDATDLGPAGNRARSTLVFLDPPYGRSLGEKALAAAAEHGWLESHAIAVLEEAKDAEVRLPPAFTLVDERTWGSTKVLFARFAREELDRR